MKKAIPRIRKQQDTQALLKKAQSKVNSVLNMFIKARDEITQANEEISKAIDKDVEKKEALERNIVQGYNSIIENQKVINRLQNFIPKN